MMVFDAAAKAFWEWLSNRIQKSRNQDFIGMGQAMNDSRKTRRIIFGCLILIALVVFVTVLTIAGGVVYFLRSFSDFDSRRDEMCLREGLEVEDAQLRFSPGMDSAMWSRFTVKADDIAEVFDASEIDPSEFDNAGYQFHVDWIGDEWWDADSRQLIGGEVEVHGGYMRVGYVVNEDGTITVYIYWFEV